MFSSQKFRQKAFYWSCNLYIYYLFVVNTGSVFSSSFFLVKEQNYTGLNPSLKICKAESRKY